MLTYQRIIGVDGKYAISMQRLMTANQLQESNKQGAKRTKTIQNKTQIAYGGTMADFFDDQNKMNEEDDIITLYNEQLEKDEDFYHIATLDLDDKWFIVMKPVEEVDDIAEDEVLIYEILEDEDGNDVFQAIEDESLLERVFDEFMKELEAYEMEEIGQCGKVKNCGCENKDEQCECGCGMSKSECDCNEKEASKGNDCGCGCGCGK